jgi:phospho-N-acetylmuramoyl-pentapeptide-transferase
MLYYIFFQWLYKSFGVGGESIFFKGLNVFQYVTFRTTLATITALLISLLLGGPVIRKLKRLNIGQEIREELSQEHQDKKGTPTMGGVLILLSMLTSTLLWADLSNRYILLLLGVTLLFGAVGWVDDYRKVVQKNSIGLPARWKYFWQSLIGIAAALFLFQNATIAEQTQL